MTERALRVYDSASEVAGHSPRPERLVRKGEVQEGMALGRAGSHALGSQERPKSGPRAAKSGQERSKSGPRVA